MHSRTARSALALTAALTALPAVASAAPAVAASPAAPPAPRPASCAISVPATVVSSGTGATATARLATSCPQGSSATWSLVSPTRTEITKITVSGTRTVTVTIPTRTASAFGRYRLVPVSGTDAQYGLMIVAPGSLSVKAGSRLSVGAKGSRITAVATRYDAASRRFVPWSRAHVTLQKKVCVGRVCRWGVVGVARADARGRATLTRPAGRVPGLRVVTSATTEIGGRTVAVPTR